ncbi:uncharacterized protein LY89DRAFT_766125 [Mollisia scopiformis]|uniref:Tetratricopeptide repeat protein n=1 Tax=Mollisia scopiformis TaxID=149040 RepID=A0A132B745_MOLSC|nr:uncharacterized protein LY89DRAFT_766125 [Mollisia scopiformis]KUJ07497.1 hypothetical protein LY89DRAFT_766125 [Mollisia scopiformis]
MDLPVLRNAVRNPTVNNHVLVEDDVMRYQQYTKQMAGLSRYLGVEYKILPGFLRRGGDYILEVLAGYDESSYNDHAFRLTGMFKEAEEISEDAGEKGSATLGGLHPAYDGMRDLGKAISKGEHVELLSSRSLPKDHPLLLQEMAMQGIRYYRHQKYDQAREYYQKIHYGILLFQSGKADEASEILEALLPEAKRVLGVTDKHVSHKLILLYCQVALNLTPLLISLPFSHAEPRHHC